MAEFTIKDEDLASLKGKVVIITGCSSGIGLATTRLLLEVGASVVGADLMPASVEHTSFQYVKCSVTSWDDLSNLFRTANAKHGHIDHVFANAGITTVTSYLDETVNEDGILVEPNHSVLDINLKGVINTCALAFHYMRRQDTGGSVVATGSASSFQPFRAVDYATAKHGVLGFVRGMAPSLKAEQLPIRINAIAPSWTSTNLFPAGMVEAAGKAVQSPEVPARSTALLMADSTRHGQLIYSWEGRYKEIEEVLLKGVDVVLDGAISDDLVMERMHQILANAAQPPETK